MIARGAVGRSAVPLPRAADCAGRRLSTTACTISRPLRPHAPLPWHVPLFRFVFLVVSGGTVARDVTGSWSLLLAFAVKSFINDYRTSDDLD